MIPEDFQRGFKLGFIESFVRLTLQANNTACNNIYEKLGLINFLLEELDEKPLTEEEVKLYDKTCNSMLQYALK